MSYNLGSKNTRIIGTEFYNENLSLTTDRESLVRVVRPKAHYADAGVSNIPAFGETRTGQRSGRERGDHVGSVRQERKTTARAEKPSGFCL